MCSSKGDTPCKMLARCSALGVQRSIAILATAISMFISGQRIDARFSSGKMFSPSGRPLFNKHAIVYQCTSINQKVIIAWGTLEFEPQLSH